MKFELRVAEVQYVGHVISKDGLKVNPEKVRPKQEMPAPTDVAGVKRFLGIEHYSFQTYLMYQNRSIN